MGIEENDAPFANFRVRSGPDPCPAETKQKQGCGRCAIILIAILCILLLAVGAVIAFLLFEINEGGNSILRGNTGDSPPTTATEVPQLTSAPAMAPIILGMAPF